MNPATEKQKNFIKVICREKQIPVPEQLEEFSTQEASGFLKGLGIKSNQGESQEKKAPEKKDNYIDIKYGQAENLVFQQMISNKENPLVDRAKYTANVLSLYTLMVEIEGKNIEQ